MLRSPFPLYLGREQVEYSQLVSSGVSFLGSVVVIVMFASRDSDVC